MTPLEAKENLPNVKVKIGNKVLDAQVSGRQLDHAQVLVKVKVYGQEIFIKQEYNWHQIAKVANGESDFLLW